MKWATTAQVSTFRQAASTNHWPLLAACVLTLGFSAAGHADRVSAAEAKAAPPERLLLRDGWLLKSTTQVAEQGDVVSTTAFAPKDWYPTTVPATVLTALVANGVYPDLRVGLNAMLIPDSSDEFNQEHDLARYSCLPGKRNPWRDPYWYRTAFVLPRNVKAWRPWLNFQAVNYRADVWLNGRQVADHREMAGALRRFRFDASEQAVPGMNCLAVKIYPVDHPGVPSTQLEVFGKDRNYHTELMKDVTLAMFVGYDCMPTAPDRNMGLWQEVFLDFTGPVDVRDPFVVTDLPLPATSPAYLTVSAEVHNATAGPQKGILRGTIVEDGLEFEKPVALAPGETRTVTFSREDGPQPVLKDPRLWWPHNYGPQNLYTLRLSFETEGGVSDVESTCFGVREITKELYELDGQHGLRLHVNGERVFCRGGYIQPEVLFNWDARRMDTEVRYFTEANLTHVYFEDIANPPDAFLDACDRHGLLFGNCFYGCYWMTPGSDHPLDVPLLDQCTVDILKRYRNHPSLWLYMAMNEGDTRQDVYEMWRKHVVGLDGTRVFIPSGSFPDYRENPPAWVRQDMPVGMNDWTRGKSYGWQEPAQYFRWVRDERGWMFMMECGSASLPPVDSLRRFIPDLFTAPGADPFPLTKTWAHHGANHYYRPYDAALRRLHGEPESVEDYCMKGHLVTADQHRAMFEATHHRMWDVTSGLTEWKINACWPSVQWQIFDWYLRPMVSYYYIKKACEPVHVQLSPLDQTVTVVNQCLRPQESLTVRARVYDLQMKLRWERSARTDVAANAYKDVLAIPPIDELTPVYFVRLDLADRDGKRLSDNFYWLSAATAADFRPLAGLPPVALRTSCEAVRQGDTWQLRAKVTNPTDRLAFFVHLAATKGPGGEEVLPVFWDDNYFSLLPGESRELIAQLDAAALDGAEPALEVGGWNVRSPFECTRLAASKTQATVGEAVSITATVAHTFLDGSPIELYVDKKPAALRRLWARGAVERDVVFPLTLTEPGTHEIAVGSRTLSISVSPAPGR